MKLSTLILGILPLVGILASPCDTCSGQHLDISASPPVRRDDVYNNAVANGEKRMAELSASVASGIEAPVGQDNFAEITETPKGSAQTPGSANLDYRDEIDSFLGVDGRSRTFYKVSLWQPTPAGAPDMFCAGSFSPKTGVIAVDYIKKSSYTTNDISETLYQEYLRIAETHRIPAHQIQGVVQHLVDNEIAAKIIIDIYKAQNKDSNSDNITFKSGTEEFFALVGSPSGAPALYLLKDHFNTIGKSTIDSVMIVKRDGARANTLIFRYA